MLYAHHSRSTLETASVNNEDGVSVRQAPLKSALRLMQEHKSNADLNIEERCEKSGWARDPLELILRRSTLLLPSTTHLVSHTLYAL